ncbi:hypothetical protein PR048_007458 [Dryococelus australis]|uniref:Uncharacterized protein n=1 Tax=Dryococelus australis TaxID=614101 RepID=A0ABQ9HUB1_9NEOP|nr:hypothetical protein PR048_007458 [Dryococelus australis]
MSAGPACLHRFSPCSAEKLGSYKGHTGTCYKSAIASTLRAPNWRAVFSAKKPRTDYSLPTQFLPDLSKSRHTNDENLFYTHRHSGITSATQDGAFCSFITRIRETRNTTRASVAERLACSPPAKVIQVQSPAGPLRTFACGNRGGRCRSPAGTLGDTPPPPQLRWRSVLTSITLISSQDLDVKSRPNPSTPTRNTTIQQMKLLGILPRAWASHLTLVEVGLKVVLRGANTLLRRLRSLEYPTSRQASSTGGATSLSFDVYCTLHYEDGRRRRSTEANTQSDRPSARDTELQVVPAIGRGAEEAAARRGLLSAPRSSEPMKVIEVSMERLRNEREGGKTGDSRENIQTNRIVWHDSHLRKPVYCDCPTENTWMGFFTAAQRGLPLRHPLVKVSQRPRVVDAELPS